MKKLLALDIDGTLANSNFEISDENITWIKRAKDQAYVLLTSTRPHKSVVSVAEKMGLDNCIVVSMAGCDIREYPSGKIIYQKAIPKQQVVALMQFARQFGCYLQIFNMDGDYFFLEENEYSGMYEAFLKYPGQKYREACLDMKIGKVIYVTEDQRLSALEKELPQHLPQGLRAEKVWRNILEVFDASVTKGQAVQKIAQLLGIARKDIISMGDEEVDISMFRVSGLAVAVANAQQAVKDAADIVTVSNDEHAVAQVIKTYILNEGEDLK